MVSLLLLACAEPEPEPIVVSPEPTASLDLRVDLFPGAWPNVLEGAGEVAVAGLANEAVDPLALEQVALWSWDRSASVELADPTPEDVDGDGLTDSVWRVSSADVEALLGGEAGRVVLEGEAWNGSATGWDLGFTAAALLTELPRPTGPWPVGTLLTSAPGDRDDPLTATGRPRVLPVQVWFPTEVGPGAQPGASYLNLAEAQSAAGWYGLAPDHFDRVLGHAHVGVPVQWVRPVDAWPVILLTPGDGPVAAHGALATELASHGYVVVGVNPPFSGIPSILPDGTDATVPEVEDVTFDDVVDVWVEDASQLLDTVADWSSSDLRFEELLDRSRVVHVGVGLGGTAAIDACRADSRLLACVDLDGTPSADVVEGKTGQALLVVSTGTRFADEPLRETVLTETLTRSWSVELVESGPGALWDLGHHADSPYVDLDTGAWSAADGHAAAAAYTVDFLDSVLRGGAGARLAAGDAEGITVRRFGD